MRLTQRQETFCIKYFELGNATEAALIAGYSPRSIRNIASVNLTNTNIQKRLKELNQAVEDASIATVLERKQILTEITRGRVSNLLGDDQRIKQGGNIDTAAIQELDTMDVKIGKGENAKLATITRVKLHNPIQAITELNKMERIYSDGAILNVDNRVVNINVSSEKAKELTQRLLGGERTDAT